VHFDTLQAGDLLLADVRLLDGRLLLSSGQQLTAATLQRLRNFGKLHAVREPILIQPVLAGRDAPAPSASAPETVRAG
jgi:hypothetical protein